MSDGNVLVTYTTEIGGVPGLDDGVHIRGQVLAGEDLYGPTLISLGQPIGPEIAFTFPEDVRLKDYDVVALANNEVAIMAYQYTLNSSILGIEIFEDEPMVIIYKLGQFGNIVSTSERFSDGRATFHRFGFSLTNLGEDDFVMFGWDQAFGIDTVLFRPRSRDYFPVFDDDDVVVEDELNHVRQADDDAMSEMTTLNNGNLAVVLKTDGPEEEMELNYLVYRPDGTAVRVNGRVGKDDNKNYEAKITALQDGGFVIVFTEDDGGDKDIAFKIYDQHGNSRTPLKYTGVTAHLANNHNEPAVAALDDGGFIIFYDKDNGTPQIRGQRFDIDGNPFGADFVVMEENGGQISAVGLDDGKVSVAYTTTGKVVKNLIFTP